MAIKLDEQGKKVYSLKIKEALKATPQGGLNGGESTSIWSKQELMAPLLQLWHDGHWFVTAKWRPRTKKLITAITINTHQRWLAKYKRQKGKGALNLAMASGVKLF